MAGRSMSSRIKTRPARREINPKEQGRKATASIGTLAALTTITDGPNIIFL